MKSLFVLLLALGSFAVSAAQVSSLHSGGSDCGDRSAQSAIVSGSTGGITTTGTNQDG